MDVAELVTTCQVVPDQRYAGLWDSIVVETAIKDRLLRSALLSLQVRPRLRFEVTALHGLQLLYGPPGTGKTTLARGLAQELAPLTSYGKARLVEVNPYGLMSAEHGQSQRKVSQLLGEHIPALVDDGLPTVVVLDEVEAMAVARSEASLAANPADVHRATDAVLTALDANAAALPHLLVVATSNFTGTLDGALLSRADVVIEVPLPDAAAAGAILRATLTGMAEAYPALARLAIDPALGKVAARLAGIDGRRIRKTVTEAMLLRLDTVMDPGNLTVSDLHAAATRICTVTSVVSEATAGDTDAAA